MLSNFFTGPVPPYGSPISDMPYCDVFSSDHYTCTIYMPNTVYQYYNKYKKAGFTVKSIIALNSGFVTSKWPGTLSM